MIDQIFVDLDDVCNRFTMHTLRYMGCTCGLDDKYFPQQVGYDITKACNLLHPAKNDWTSDEFWGRLPAGVWDALPVRTDCYKLLETCASLVGHNNVFILTKSLPQPEHYAGKMAWIYNHMPDWICGQIQINGQKYTNARLGALLIDDSYNNVNDFRQTRSGRAILVPRPWNVMHDFQDPMEWVKDQLIRLFKSR
jgi:5'(3')-deoxyribonucleotidase